MAAVFAPNVQQDINTVCAAACVDHYKRDGNPQEEVCPANIQKDYHGACRNPAQHDNVVYGMFGANWNRVAGIILRRFIDRGLDDAHNIFRGMINVLFPLSDYTMKIIFDASLQYEKCKDVVCSYQIANRLNMGAKTKYFNLFHISLHSAKPIYFQGATRRVFSCAPYKDIGQNQGAFHYKIDSDRHLNNLPNIPPKPHRRLISQGDGTFEQSQESFEIDKTNQQEINYAIFHEYIYYRFITYWNSCIEYVSLHNPNINNDQSPWGPTSNPNRIHDIRIEDKRDDPASIDRAMTNALRFAAPTNQNPLNHTITRSIPHQLIEATQRIIAVRDAAVIGKTQRSAAIRAARAQDPLKAFRLSNFKRLGNERREREAESASASASGSASVSAASAATSAASAFRLNRPPEYRQVSNYGLGAASASAAASALSAEEKAVENGEAAVAAAHAKRAAAEQRLEEARMAVAAARAIEEPLARALTQARAEVTAATAARPSKVKSASTIQAELIQKRSAEGLVKKQHLESHGKVAEALRKETFAQQAIASANVGIQKARANIERARRNAALRKQEATSASATSASAASASANNNNNINYSMFGNISNNKESNHPVASVNNRQSRQRQQQRRKSVRTPSPTPPGYNKERNRKEARKGGRTKKNNKKKRNTRKR